MENYSLSDIKAVTNGNDDGMFGGNWAIFLFFILALGGGSGLGFGGKEQYATSADVQRGFDTNSIINKLDGITNGICDSSFALNNSIKDTAFATQQGIANLGYANQLGFANVTSAVNDCCCKQLRAIDGISNDICKQTYEITGAIHNEGEATRALINANVVQSLRDKVADKDREIQSANFQISQVSQTNAIESTILNSIGRYVTNPPCPTPCGCY